MALAVLGCAETPPAAAPTGPVAPVAVEPLVPVAVAPDLTPVAEPSDLILVARWANPNATLSRFGGCTGLPQQILDQSAAALVERALDEALRGGADAKALADVVARDAPVDLVGALETGRRGQPGVALAFSVGLTSLERAKSAIEVAGPVMEFQPGYFRVGSGSSELSCVVGAASGPAPARLVCGMHDRDVAALAPYLTRNLAAAPAPARDLHAELRFVPIEARYGGELRSLLTALPKFARFKGIGEPRFDDALDVAAHALGEEGKALTSDLDHVSVDLSVDPSACLTGAVALQLRGKSSWLSGTIVERASKSGPPPAIFWRAPIDSDSASFGRGTDAARYDPILRTLRGLLEGKLAKEQIGSEADRKALGALLAMPFGKDTNVVFASGHPSGAPKPASAEKLSREQLAASLAASAIGWHLVGLDEGPAALGKLIKDIVAVYGRKGLTDPLRRALGHDAASLPTVKLVPAPAQLGRGALDVELRFALEREGDPPADAAAKKKATPVLALHVLLMGEARAAWLAVGADRDELVKRLLAVRGSAPDAGTLAARAGLEPLRSGTALGAGFVTLGTLTRGFASVLSSPVVGRTRILGDLVNTLNNLPHKGETPIFLGATTTAAGPRTELAVNMQKGSLEDLGAILLTAHRIATSTGLLRP